MIVTVLCDLGIKYLTKVFNGDWLHKNNISVSDEEEEEEEENGVAVKA